MKRRRGVLASKSWRCGPVLDQGSEPSCVGHAWFGWLAASPIRQSPMLPDAIYQFAKFYDEWRGQNYEGTSVRGAAKVLAVAGHVSEYQWAWDLDTALPWLVSNGPLVAGVNWYEGMCYPNAAGLIVPSGEVVGGHAVLVYGLDVRRQLVKIRNSWGTGWGRRGNCLLSFDDFARLLAEDGECCAATERAQR